jgi:hypothetical protein
MMEANDMLLRDWIRVPAPIKFHPQIEEFHLTPAEVDAAQQGRRGDALELGRRAFKTGILLNHSLLRSASNKSIKARILVAGHFLFEWP